MAIHFSEVLSKMKGSDLGPLLALTAQPDIISFAGGLPAPRTFPLKELTEVAVKVREEDGAGAMQYGPSLRFHGTSPGYCRPHEPYVLSDGHG